MSNIHGLAAFSPCQISVAILYKIRGAELFDSEFMERPLLGGHLVQIGLD